MNNVTDMKATKPKSTGSLQLTKFLANSGIVSPFNHYKSKHCQWYILRTSKEVKKLKFIRFIYSLLEKIPIVYDAQCFSKSKLIKLGFT